MRNSSPRFYAQGSVSANVPTALGTPILVGDVSVKAGGEGRWWDNPRSFDLPLGTPGGLGLPPTYRGMASSPPHHPCFKQATTELFWNMPMAGNGAAAPNTPYSHYGNLFFFDFINSVLLPRICQSRGKDFCSRIECSFQMPQPSSLGPQEWFCLDKCHPRPRASPGLQRYWIFHLYLWSACGKNKLKISYKN